MMLPFPNHLSDVFAPVLYALPLSPVHFARDRAGEGILVTVLIFLLSSVSCFAFACFCVSLSR